MSTTIVFACKSNSCRSQMAEAWAREWIRAERIGLEKEGDDGDDDDASEQRRRLRSFLDGLMVASVALDESSVEAGGGTSASSLPPSDGARLLGTSPTSTLTTNFETSSPSASAGRRCVTCDGEACTPTSPSSSKRRKPKEKAIQAMAQDGVDISSYYTKSFKEILPFILRNHRRSCGSGTDDALYNSRCGNPNWKLRLSFAGLWSALESVSREMGMAYAGIPRDGIYRSDKESVKETSSYERPLDTDNSHHVVDNLIVLCSCPDALKRRLSDMSRTTSEWDDIDPPTAAARAGEGDGAYLRVSRRIRDRVDDFLGELKRCALIDHDGNADDDLYGANDCWNAD
mmetsp:Transcript_34259/g.82853  ORF Transcript_34259/g.82853 Transcript_34259/m.82853 type:complete len:344 (+) Transcript_34259:122-1153(+)